MNFLFKLLGFGVGSIFKVVGFFSKNIVYFIIIGLLKILLRSKKSSVMELLDNPKVKDFFNHAKNLITDKAAPSSTKANSTAQESTVEELSSKTASANKKNETAGFNVVERNISTRDVE